MYRDVVEIKGNDPKPDEKQKDGKTAKEIRCKEFGYRSRCRKKKETVHAILFLLPKASRLLLPPDEIAYAIVVDVGSTSTSS
jgi:hypothetical protein